MKGKGRSKSGRRGRGTKKSKATRTRGAKTRTGGEAEAKPKRPSALNAAAEVLRTSGEPMTCKAMIEAMGAAGLWTSPAGKTPAATLYSAILREITKKGEASRFRKVDRGQFALAGGEA